MADGAVIDVLPGGRVRYLWADELRGLCDQGAARVARASHVEPVCTGGGSAAWEVDLRPIGGSVHGGFATRGEALAFERAFLQSEVGMALLDGLEGTSTRKAVVV